MVYTVNMKTIATSSCIALQLIANTASAAGGKFDRHRQNLERLKERAAQRFFKVGDRVEFDFAQYNAGQDDVNHVENHNVVIGSVCAVPRFRNFGYQVMEVRKEIIGDNDESYYVLFRCLYAFSYGGDEPYDKVELYKLKKEAQNEKPLAFANKVIGKVTQTNDYESNMVIEFPSGQEITIPNRYDERYIIGLTEEEFAARGLQKLKERLCHFSQKKKSAEDELEALKKMTYKSWGWRESKRKQEKLVLIFGKLIKELEDDIKKSEDDINKKLEDAAAASSQDEKETRRRMTAHPAEILQVPDSPSNLELGFKVALIFALGFVIYKSVRAMKKEWSREEPIPLHA